VVDIVCEDVLAAVGACGGVTHCAGKLDAQGRDMKGTMAL
jgi:hypothetical protein